jgi:hypothetical protein
VKIWVILLFWATLMGLWSMSVWGGWAERHYERAGESSLSWFWLRRCGVATTKENCLRFLKGVSLAGMILLTLGVVVILLT